MATTTTTTAILTTIKSPTLQSPITSTMTSTSQLTDGISSTLTSPRISCNTVSIPMTTVTSTSDIVPPNELDVNKENFEWLRHHLRFGAEIDYDAQDSASELLVQFTSSHIMSYPVVDGSDCDPTQHSEHPTFYSENIQREPNIPKKPDERGNFQYENLGYDYNEHIVLFGRTEQQQSVFVNIKIWPCMVVYAPPGEGIDKKIQSTIDDRRFRWNQYHIEYKMCHKMGGFHPDYTSDKPKLAEFRYAFVYFDSIMKLKTIRRKLIDVEKCQVLENFITPQIQFIQSCGTQVTGIVKLMIDPTRCQPVLPARYSWCDLEYTAQFKPWEPATCPLQKSDRKDVFPIRVASFDIETTGLHPLATMDPTSGEMLPACSIFCINTILFNASQRESPLLYATHVVGQVRHVYPDRLYFEYDTEEEAIAGWRDFIINTDPDILTSYNGTDFDIPFMIERNNLLAEGSRVPFLSKLRKYKCVLYESSFESAQRGESACRRLMLPGRIDLDVMKYIMTRYTHLSNHSLKTVCEEYLPNGINKDDMEHSRMHRAILQSQVRHTLNAQQEAKLDDELDAIEKYCWQDCFVLIELWKRLQICNGMVSMSRVTSTIIRDLLERGEGIKVLSQVFVFARRLNFVMSEFNSPNCGSYQGATVLDPLTGYYAAIATLDFASLYPSIMIALNLCWSSYVEPGDLQHRAIEYRTIKTDIGEWKFQQTIPSVCQLLLRHLLGERKIAKNEMEAAEKAEDTVLASVLNSQQLALKLSSNSVYGFTGASNVAYPSKQISSTVTAYGRHLIMTTKAIVESQFKIHPKYGHVNAQVVYGDTDSVMVWFAGISEITKETLAAIWDMGREAAALICRSFEKDIQIVLEKILRPFLLYKKKSYVKSRHVDLQVFDVITLNMNER
jgi:DNA polymerase elongation subunit (family B)